MREYTLLFSHYLTILIIKNKRCHTPVIPEVLDLHHDRVGDKEILYA